MDSLLPACQNAILEAINHANATPKCVALAVNGSIPLKDKSLVMVMMTPDVYKKFKKMMEQECTTFHAYLN